MSDHLHLISRSRPDVVAPWDNAEVTLRRLIVCPERQPSKRKSSNAGTQEARRPEPTQAECDAILSDSAEGHDVRSRLNNIS